MPAFLLLALLALAPPAWAAPTVESRVTTVNTGTTTTSHTINLPTCAAGKLFVILSVFDSNINAGDPTWPAGWTQRHETDATSYLTQSYYRVADGTEGSSITVTTTAGDDSAHHAFCVSGQHASSAPEISTRNTETSEFPDPPSLSPSWGSEDALWIVGIWMGTGATGVDTYPANYTNGALTQSSGSSVGSTYRSATTGTEDPGTFDLAASIATTTATLGIRPAAVSGCQGARRPLTGVGC